MNSHSIKRLAEEALSVQREELDENGRNLALQTLIDSPSEQIFELAAQYCASSDANLRLLGVRILSELGRPERPFAARATEVLEKTIEVEVSDELLPWEVAALGNQHQPSALQIIIPIATHHLPAVRYSVAGAISMASADTLTNDSLVALGNLSQDVDRDVRWSSVFEVASWWSNQPSEELKIILEASAADPDEQIAELARSALSDG